MELTKGHGTGNDFLILADPDDEIALSATEVRALCDRRTGVGADGVLRVVRTEHIVADSRADWFMDHRNSDGTVGIMCGNGVRVFARYLVDRGLADPGRMLVATRGGLRELDVPERGEVRVDMGPARRLGSCWVRLGDQTYGAEAVLMPNPHAVVSLDSLSGMPERLPRPEVDPGVFPEGANVEFVQRQGPGRLRMRVFERGAGETMSCGTGACAAAAVLAQPSVEVLVDGGRLRIDVGRTLHMTGPAELVADLRVREAG